MYIIAGLGNPDKKYERTRHNAGWIVVDEIVSRESSEEWHEDSHLKALVASGAAKGVSVEYLRPLTYMNLSGQAIREAVKKHSVENDNVIIVHDDLDLPFGEIKIAQGKGSGGHNGVESIQNHLGSNDFIRIRIGIAPTGLISKFQKMRGGSNYVLSKFTPGEYDDLRREVAPKADKAIEIIMEKGVRHAMNEIH